MTCPSNPVSALDCPNKSDNDKFGKVSEWPNEHAWKACVLLASTVGSNPILSAIFILGDLYLKKLEI